MSLYTHNVVSTTVLNGVPPSTSCRLTLDWIAFLIYLLSTDKVSQIHIIPSSM